MQQTLHEMRGREREKAVVRGSEVTLQADCHNLLALNDCRVVLVSVFL